MDQDPRALQNEELYRQWRDARSEWDTEARKDIDFYHFFFILLHKVFLYWSVWKKERLTW